MIELIRFPDGFVTLRNSDDPDAPVLMFTEQMWDEFVIGVRNGEFDLRPQDRRAPGSHCVR